MNMENFVRDYLVELEAVVKGVSQEDISRVMALLYQAWKDGKQVFVAGNGGSASTATLSLATWQNLLLLKVNVASELFVSTIIFHLFQL
jgi:phosphoheptose isomerase